MKNMITKLIIAAVIIVIAWFAFQQIRKYMGMSAAAQVTKTATENVQEEAMD